jgi:hypothetical protein
VDNKIYKFQLKLSPNNIIQYFYYTIFLSYSIDELVGPPYITILAPPLLFSNTHLSASNQTQSMRLCLVCMGLYKQPNKYVLHELYLVLLILARLGHPGWAGTTTNQIVSV